MEHTKEEEYVPQKSILNLGSETQASNEDTDDSSIRSLDTVHHLLQSREPYEPAIKVPEDLYKNIKLKLKVLSDRDKIIQIKLNKYQRKHENLNMLIIIVSSILGIYETFRVKIDDIVKSQFIDVSTNIIPIVLSGIITCTASIIKLKKYQEKSDQIHLTREKVSVARANLKTVQEHLLFCKKKEDLHKIKKIYFQNAFNAYCDGNAYLDKYVKEVDFRKYGERICYSDKYPKDDIEIDIPYPDGNNNDDAEDELKTPKFPKQAIVSIKRDRTIKI
jgi:hypothetical protein